MHNYCFTIIIYLEGDVTFKNITVLATNAQRLIIKNEGPQLCTNKHNKEIGYLMTDVLEFDDHIPTGPPPTLIKSSPFA